MLLILTNKLDESEPFLHKIMLLHAGGPGQPPASFWIRMLAGPPGDQQTAQHPETSRALLAQFLRRVKAARLAARLPS